MMTTITCGRCPSGTIKTAWHDRKSEISRGRCGSCGRIRELTGSEFGRHVLREIQAGRQQPIGAALTIGGPR